MKKRITGFALWILPLCFLLLGLSFNRAKYSNDPEYIYLVNALNLLKLKPVGHFDNPGTTVMELGAAVILITHWFDSTATADVITEVIKNPDRYVETFNTVFIMLITMVLLFVGKYTLRKTGNILAALIIQITPFLSANVLEHAWTKTSPEPMLLIISLLFSALVIRYFYEPHQGKIYYVFLFAIFSGFGLATKLTFLPLVIIPLIILTSWRNRIIYLALIVPAFLLFTFPALPEFRNMLQWYYNLLTHKGIYGQGEKGFIDVAAYFSSVRDIFWNNKSFTLMLIVSIGVLTWTLLKGSGKRSDKRAMRILTALAIAHLLAVIMVAKHYHHNHYLLPALSLTGLSLFFAAKSLSPLITHKWFEKAFFAAMLFLFLTYGAFSIGPNLAQANYYYRLTNIEMERTQQLADTGYASYKPVYYYPTSLNKYSALHFGNDYSKSRNLSDIKRIYPNILFYNRLTNQFTSWGAPLEISEVLSTYGDRLLLAGGPLTHEEFAFISENGYPITRVHYDRTQALYIFDTSVLHEVAADALRVISKMYCDMERLTDDGQYFVSGEWRFYAGSTATNEKARSGRQAVRLDKQQVFSLEHFIDDAHPGDRFRISIWRYSDSNDGHLVAASAPDQFFYRQVSDYVSTDSDQWKRISLHFTVPDLTGNNRIKIYVWNSGKDVVYFDDLLIEKF